MPTNYNGEAGNVKFYVKGKLIGEGKAEEVFKHVGTLQSLGTPMPEEELAEFRRQWEALERGNEEWQVKEKEQK